MSQGTGRPKKKERDGGRLVSGAVRAHTAFIKLAVWCGSGVRQPVTVTAVISKSFITDPHTYNKKHEIL